MYIKGIFFIFLIWGGEKYRGIYIIELEINMNFDQKALSIQILGLKGEI